MDSTTILAGRLAPRRAERVEQNRERLLAAALDVFRDRGYGGASLDAIADRAGFSKGVVYSQFESKADLFLALLDRRITERAAAQLAFVDELSGVDDWPSMVAHVRTATASDPAWSLLVIEFRVVAARDPVLRARYATSHSRTIDGVATMLAMLYERVGQRPPAPLDDLAVMLIALNEGGTLEEVARPDPLPEELLFATISRLLDIPLPHHPEEDR